MFLLRINRGLYQFLCLHGGTALLRPGLPRAAALFVCLLFLFFFLNLFPFNIVLYLCYTMLFLLRRLMLILVVRLFYLPPEFGNILLCTVYIPPSGNAANAAKLTADFVHRQLRRTPEAPCFILGILIIVYLKLCCLDSSICGL